MSIASPLEIEISGSFNNSNRNVDLDITIIATAQINYSNLKVRTAVTESQLYSNGRYHDHTFRDMLPNTSGISFSISQGDTLTFNQNFTLNSQLDEDNCEVVLFVQSDNGRRILQGAKEGITTLAGVYALDPFSLISPAPGDTIRTCFPNFEWEASNDPDSGYAVDYEVMVDLSPLFPSPILSGALSDTTWLSPFCLMNDTTYYWKVRAFNGHAPEIFSNELNYFRLIEYGNIGGIITDDSLNVLDGVLAELVGLGRMDTSDGAGSYSFDELLDGTYDIAFSMSGYRDTTITGINVSSGNTAIVDVAIIGLNCQYIPGDANGSGGANGLDVIYLVSFLKGGPAPSDTCLCDPHGNLMVGADANGSCSVNGLDVTYMVAYFKGTGVLLYCTDCPPAE